VKALQYVQVLLLIAGIAYLVAFHLANRVGLAFPIPFGNSSEAPASLALLGGFLAGLAYASLVFIPPDLRRINAARRLERRNRDLETSLAGLRQTPTVPVIPDRSVPAEASGATVVLSDGSKS
jgi:putative membrane protein